MRVKISARFALLFCVAFALAACGASGGASEGSGQVVLYTSEPQENADTLVAAFNEDHPEIEVQVVRNGTGNLLARIESERQAGGVQGDVMVAADATSFEQLKEDDVFQKYEPEGSENIEDRFKDPEGYYVGTRLISTVIGYNTNEVEDPPQSWAELADPEYRGMIGMPSPDYSGAAAYNTAVWANNPDLGWDWIEGVVSNEPSVVEGNGEVQQGIATGQYPVGIIIDYMMRDIQEDGSPVDMVFPEEGVPAIYQPAAIFADARDPEAARTFVDWLISDAGQQIAVEQSYVPIRSDIEGPENAPDIEDIDVMEGDVRELSEQLDPARERFNELLSQGG
jgi:iron(III) transport system substrate-binding protein